MNLTINTGEIEITINNDPNRVIRFNPDDISFIDGFYELINDFQAKNLDYISRAQELEKNEEKDENGIPKNIGAIIALNKEICTYLREQIDNVFGKGTSQTVFGNINTIDVFVQFFEGITPIIQQKRQSKISKYIKDAAGNSRVMK